MRARLLGIRNAARFASRRQQFLGLVLFACSLGFFAGLSGGFGIFLIGVRQAVGDDLALVLVRRMVSGLLLFLFAGGVPFLSHVLFAPGDLALLGPTPVSPRVIAAVRLIEGAVAASAQFLVLGVPILLASLWFVGLPWWGVPLAVAFLVLFLALPASAVGVLLFGLARALGVRRVKTVVAVVSVFLAVGVCLLAVSEAARFRLDGRLSDSLHRMVALEKPGAPGSALLPTTWASDALLGLGGKCPAPRAWGGGLLLFALTSGLSVLAIALGGPLLARGEELREGESTARQRPDPLALLLFRLPLPRPVCALVVKDLRYVLRDLTLLSQVGVPLILYGVPFLLASEASRVGAGKAELLGLAAFSVGFIAYMMCSILGLSSVGLEGRAFYLLKASPVTARQLVLAKWTMAFLPTTLIALILCLFACLALGAEPWALALALGAIPVGCGALCGIEVGLSGIFPRFLFENPAHRASVAALIWGFVAATTYALLALVPLVAIVFGLTTGHPALAVGAGAAFVLFSLGVGYFPLRLAARRLETYAWEN